MERVKTEAKKTLVDARSQVVQDQSKMQALAKRMNLQAIDDLAKVLGPRQLWRSE